MGFDARFESLDLDLGEVTIHVTHGGKGPPLLLLHGYPQTHQMWHLLAPHLADHFHVICMDLRGYGRSSKPAGLPDHANYSKRAMAQDAAQVCERLGFDRFMLAGHDRGARVAHRLMVDYPDKVSKGCVMDICPTYHMFKTASQHFATGYYHWFFLIQPDGLPEKMIGANPEYYLREKLRRWAAPGATFDEKAVADYVACFSSPEAIHASCEDYRAAASIDLLHDEQDMGAKIQCPLLVLWGQHGFVNRTYDVLNVWRERAEDVQGHAVNSGHFLPEEAPDEVLGAMMEFFGG